MRFRPIALWAFCVGAELLPQAGVGQDFSGSYKAQPSKSDPKTEAALVVIQDKDAIEFTRMADGKTTKNRCPFSGMGVYTSPGGPQGTCSAKVKGNALIVESLVNTSTVRLHTREKWQLSKDMKMLTISSQLDVPGLSEVSAALGDTMSSTVKYTRSPGN